MVSSQFPYYRLIWKTQIIEQMISSIKALKYQDLLTKDKWNFPLLAPKLFKSKTKMVINWETTFFMLWKDLIVDEKNIS